MAIDPKKALGRPTLYKVEYCDALIEHMKAGLSFEAFGAVAHVGRRTLFDWLAAFPDFQAAKEIGESHSLIVWEKEGQAIVKHGGGPGSAAVWIFNMRNRFSWRDDPKEPKKTDETERLAASGLTDEELDQQLQAKLEKLQAPK